MALPQPGHWRGDSVDLYMRTSTHTATKGFSSKMLEFGNYKFTSFQADEPDIFPDCLPDDAPPAVYEAYLRSLFDPTDDVDSAAEDDV